MVYDGNRDLVSDDGNREVIRESSTNFNETLEISTKGHLNQNTSTIQEIRAINHTRLCVYSLFTHFPLFLYHF